MQFEKCSIQINDTLVDEIDFINIAMPVYNLIEYSATIMLLQEAYGNLKEMKM